MEEWLQKYATALEERLGRSERALWMSPSAKNPLLTLARIVAHGTERKNAPLATYIAGRYVAARIAESVDEDEAVAEALEIAQSLTPASDSRS